MAGLSYAEEMLDKAGGLTGVKVNIGGSKKVTKKSPKKVAKTEDNSTQVASKESKVDLGSPKKGLVDKSYEAFIAERRAKEKAKGQ